MKPNTLFILAVMVMFHFQIVFNQGSPLAKSIDTIHHSAVAILRVDSSGHSSVCASGVLILPNVVLTAGHVNFKVANIWKGGCLPTGFVSFANDANQPDNRVSFNWINDIESHPDIDSLLKYYFSGDVSPSPDRYIDLGLIFLNKSILNRPLAHLPDSFILSKITSADHLTGVGYGYDRADDSTFQAYFVDGLRRQWKPSKILLVNDYWLKSECDSVTNLSYIGMFDSGAPLFLRDNVVVGVWARSDNQTKPCPYSSIAVRTDNPKASKWIKDRVRKRLGTELK